MSSNRKSPTRSSSSFSAISLRTPRHQELDPSLYSIRPSTGFIWTAEMLEAGKAMYLATLQTPRPNPDDMQIQMSPSITNDYDEREEFEMDFNLDDDVVEIKHGSPLRKRQIEEIDKDSRKRKRFRISELPEDDRHLWSMFFEAVRLDYVQKGPDDPAPEGDTRGKKRLADNRVLIQMIKRRHRMMFREDAKPLAKRELEAVNAYQRVYDDFLGETAY